jgi:hypothetical protein
MRSAPAAADLGSLIVAVFSRWWRMTTDTEIYMACAWLMVLWCYS